MKIARSSLGLFLLALGFAAQCTAQSAPASMRPTLVALQVENLAAAIRWYTTFLDFTVEEQKDFPEHRLRLAILRAQDFELELVENPKTLKRSDALAAKGATDITGFAKLTFTIADVARRYRELRDRGATFAIDLRDSNTRPGQQYFVLLDNEKNWLQFVGRKQPG
jgi:catechol 2,3-dioxygenase-like lactoylglutathione lyase family enzyme